MSNKIAIKNNKANNNNKVKKPGKRGRKPKNGGKNGYSSTPKKTFKILIKIRFLLRCLYCR
jgi:hypothetical protein